jgi:hypothetical protein
MTPATVLTADEQRTYDVDELAAILEYDAPDCYPTREAAERRAAQLEAKQAIAQKPNRNATSPRAGASANS